MSRMDMVNIKSRYFILNTNVELPVQKICLNDFQPKTKSDMKILACTCGLYTLSCCSSLKTNTVALCIQGLWTETGEFWTFFDETNEKYIIEQNL